MVWVRFHSRKNHTKKYHRGLIRSDCNLTNFIINVQLEHPSAMSIAFDGLNRHNQSISIRVKAEYKYKEYIHYKNYDVQLPPLHILHTHIDTYWIFSSGNECECTYSDNHFN